MTGDSGGPVRRLSDGKLVGLVSFGPGNECAMPDWPGAYTRIAAVIEYFFCLKKTFANFIVLQLRPWIEVNSRI